MTRFRPIARAIAITYWLCVATTYFLALAHHDPFGFAFIPFIFLSMPWSSLASSLTSDLPLNRQIVEGSIIALLGSGVNAVLLCLAVVLSAVYGNWYLYATYLANRFATESNPGIVSYIQQAPEAAQMVANLCSQIP